MKKRKKRKHKYPALNKGENLKGRQDYIEPDYVNGVRDEKGNLVIRPCTEEEKAWLNKYYQETINADFSYDDRIYELRQSKRNIIDSGRVKELIKRRKKIKKTGSKEEMDSIQEEIRTERSNNRVTYSEKLREIDAQLVELEEEVLLYPDKKDRRSLYTENYKRNVDLYNRKKRQGLLISLDASKYDKYYSDRASSAETSDLLAGIEDAMGLEDGRDHPHTESLEDFDEFQQPTDGSDDSGD